MANYFLIHNGDGDTTVFQVDPTRLADEITRGLYGEAEFLTKLPDEPDTNYWNGKYLLIKGEIVAPKPVQTVTQYQIE